MLPIDEHAWGGAFVFAKFGRGFRVVRWDARCEWWEDQFGNALGSEHPTHYWPLPYVEQAGAMREALLSVSQCIYSNDYAEPALTTDFDQGKLDEALYATEWPKKEG